MWPMLLNMTRDECRRTLRRLELEAYSNMMSVFRAQGALVDNRKKLLEELRAALHIGNDRHSAEARRVANDELLATIAEQLSGPNTGLTWISEGRRIIPLIQRGVPQTMYTEIADKIAKIAAEDEKELKRKLEEEKLNPPKPDETMDTSSSQTGETVMMVDENVYPQIATEDPTLKLWETELVTRKRKVPEGAMEVEEVPPVKNIRNIKPNINQKHLNLSQLYSKYSQPSASKQSGQSKHSYNQVSKVSTSKSSQAHPRAHKPRKQNKNPTPVVVKAQVKKSQSHDVGTSPTKYNPVSMQLEYTGPPGSFQASYAQSILGAKTKLEYMDDIKTKAISSPGMVTDSPTMQLLTQPATVPHELGVTDSSHIEDPKMLQAQATPQPKNITSKPCHLIIKKRGEITTTNEKVKILQKPSEGNIKVLSNRQVVVTPSSTHKVMSTPTKLITTKVMSLPKSHTSTPIPSEKMIVVSKPSENKPIPASKIILTSSSMSTPSKETGPSIVTSVVSKPKDSLTPKGIPTTDLRVSAKTFVLNPKSGQKMVVVPAKGRGKPGGEGQIPFIQFKGLPGMKLVPVSSQPHIISKPQAVAVVSKTAHTPVQSSPKIVGIEPIKTANMADIVPVKGLTPVSTPKVNPIVRPASAKGNVIVLQKGTTIGKALTLNKTSSENMSKIIMGKNVNQLLQAKGEQADPKSAGNVIVLELNNDQTAQTTTMSEILDRSSGSGRTSDEGAKIHQPITQDTPVLFDTQITEETCNTSSLDSTGIGDIVPMEDASLSKSQVSTNSVEGAKDSSSVTDWEIELDTVSTTKGKDDDKLNSLHLDLGMSSDSETDFMESRTKGKTKTLQKRAPSSQASEIYSGTGGLSLTTRTLLSQLQDEGSSSNDSSFALKPKPEKHKENEPKLDKAESEALTKAKKKLIEKVAEEKSQKRIDNFSTITNLNLDSFSYLDEGMMAGDDDDRESRQTASLDEQLSRLFAEDSANSTDSQTVSESLPLSK